MTRITSGISQTGGKYRMVNTLRKYTPYHEFFLSLFLGAGHFELNKPRCRYECFNDAESEIINYMLVISGFNGSQEFTESPKKFEYDDQQVAMFEEMKQGVFGLVSQEICNRIVNGKIQPKNDLEKAYFFYYLNKLTYGGSIWKVRKNPPCALETKALKNVTDKEIEEIKKEFEGKGYCGLNQNRAIPQSTFHQKDIEEIKLQYKGLQPDGHQVRQTDVKKAKEDFKKYNASVRGITLTSSCNKESIENAKAQFKGINPKTTRPYENNNCGLLSPIDPEATKRLRYVNLTAYDFRKVYEMFYQAFHVRKGLERECFIFEDPPYPGTEKYYGDLFPKELHEELIDINIQSPFNIMQTIGGDCEFYIRAYKKAKWKIVPVKVKYSTDANSQKESQEYICMNYDIKKIAPMIFDHTQQLIKRYIYD